MTAPDWNVKTDNARDFGDELDTRRDIPAELTVLAAVLVGLAISAVCVYFAAVGFGAGWHWLFSPIESPPDDRPAYSVAPQIPPGGPVALTPVSMTSDPRVRVPSIFRDHRSVDLRAVPTTITKGSIR